jgi:hypothetical protein
VVLSGLEEDAVAGLDGLDRAAPALAQADTFGDVDRLAERVGVPGRAGAGVKCTIAAPSREGGVGFVTASMNTVPVNQSPGPALVSRELRVSCMSVLLG